MRCQAAGQPRLRPQTGHDSCTLTGGDYTKSQRCGLLGRRVCGSDMNQRPGPGVSWASKRRLYSVGVVEKALAKFCRRVTALPKPQSAATRSMDRSVVSSSRRAASSRRVRIQAEGVVPVDARKTRMKVRRLMCASVARRSMLRGSPRRPKAHSSRRPIGSSEERGGRGCSMYCACPPSRCGAITRLRATRFAASAPRRALTRCRHASSPDAVPAEVKTSP